jgi:hypothetical protein
VELRWPGSCRIAQPRTVPGLGCFVSVVVSRGLAKLGRQGLPWPQLRSWGRRAACRLAIDQWRRAQRSGRRMVMSAGGNDGVAGFEVFLSTVANVFTEQRLHGMSRRAQPKSRVRPRTRWSGLVGIRLWRVHSSDGHRQCEIIRAIPVLYGIDSEHDKLYHLHGLTASLADRQVENCVYR